MHNEFINIEGVKLSRSLGNQLLLRDLTGLVDGAGSEEVVPGFRYFVVTNHYRTTLNFTEEALEGAIRARRRLNRLHRRPRSTAGDAEEVAGGPWSEPVEEAAQGFIRHMEDDLNASPAMVSVFRLVADAERALSSGPPAPEALSVSGLIEEVDSVVGVLDETPEAEAVDEDAELPPELGRLVEERAARRAPDWDRADALRAELEAAGVMVTETPDGPLWTRRRP